MDRLFGTVFAVTSLAMSAMVILYIVVLAPGLPEGDWLAKTDYMRSNWSLYSTHWRIEFLSVAMTAFAALYFSSRNAMWLLVAVGHLFYLGQYPLMIAGYLQADTQAVFSVLNEMAVFVFAASNMLWLVGILGVYAGESGWLRVAGVSLSAIGSVAFLAMFLGIIGMEQAAIGGLPVLLLYLLNTWYGFTALSRRQDEPAQQ